MSTIYWEEEIETLPRVGLESIQLKRLQKLIGRVYKTVEPYRKKMDAAGIKADDINSLADLQKLPFTIKDDLRDNYPFGMLLCPLKTWFVFTPPLEQLVNQLLSGTPRKISVPGRA